MTIRRIVRAKQAHDFKVGHRVNHSVFGAGSVVRVEWSGYISQWEITFRFDKFSLKTLSFDFCKEKTELL